MRSSIPCPAPTASAMSICRRPRNEFGPRSGRANGSTRCKAASHRIEADGVHEIVISHFFLWQSQCRNDHFLFSRSLRGRANAPAHRVPALQPARFVAPCAGERKNSFLHKVHPKTPEPAFSEETKGVSIMRQIFVAAIAGA